MKRLNYIGITILLLTFGCFAQETKWTRIEFEKTVSVSVPDGFLVDLENFYLSSTGRIIYNCSDFEIEIVIYDYYQPRVAVRDHIENATRREKYETDDVIARRFIYTFQEPRLNQDAVIVGTNKYYYKFRVFTKNLEHPYVRRFINSIKINGKSAFPQNIESTTAAENVIRDSDLKTSSEIKLASKRKVNKIAEYAKVASIDEIYKQEVSEKKYSRLPFFVGDEISIDSFFSQSMQRKDYGRLAVCVLLKADGTLGIINIFSISNEKVVKTAIKFIQKLKFVPAQIDGKNADFVKIWDVDLDLGGNGKVINQ
jgi:hypothetical protein